MDDQTRRLRAVLKRHAPRWIDTDSMPLDMPLGPSGACLDSIATVELLASCEETFAVALPDAIFARGELTLGRILDAVRTGRAEG